MSLVNHQQQSSGNSLGINLSLAPVKCVVCFIVENNVVGRFAVQTEHDAHTSSLKKYSLRFLANDIDDPLNVGSLFRIADALGVEHIHLCGSTPTPPNRKIRKTSRATEQYVDYSQGESVHTVAALKQKGYCFICLEITSNSMDLKTLSLSSDAKVCLVMGSESRGISSEILDQSDYVFHIPMLGNNSSMNLATATAIAAYTITQQLS